MDQGPHLLFIQYVINLCLRPASTHYRFCIYQSYISYGCNGTQCIAEAFGMHLRFSTCHYGSIHEICLIDESGKYNFSGKDEQYLVGNNRCLSVDS